MDESTVYKDANSCEPGASSPGTVSVSSLAGSDRTLGTVSPCKSAWDDVCDLFDCDPSLNVLPANRPLPDHSAVLLALNERIHAVAEGVRHQRLFDARDATYQVEFLGKLLRLVVAFKLNAMINPPPRRAGVFVTDSEVG